MDNFDRLRGQARRYLFIILLVDNAAIIGTWFLAATYTSIHTGIVLAAISAIALVLTTLAAFVASTYLLRPLQAIWQTIVHLAPYEQGTPAPKIDSLKFGRELVTSLASQVYQLASVAEQAGPTDQSSNLSANFIANNLPLPVITLDKQQNINFANSAACKYLGLAEGDVVSKNVYSVLDMSFPDTQTFDNWLKGAQANAVTSTSSWERVRLKLADQKTTKYFDLAAYYNKSNPKGIETMLVIFDHTATYSQDDQAMGFIALTVHELRTPLTLLRGYIEVFEEEFAGKLSPELSDFMSKMSASAQQLTAFVNNILNVARIEDDQLVLKLNEENWGDVVKSAVANISLRAKVRGIAINSSIAPNLPTVGIDRVSIYEVLSNLLDNAIKYSDKSKKIQVSASLNKEGDVETSVKDFGVGIPANIMSNLFSKFYRSHRSRTQVGGTGLGLYLSKAIVAAHGGNIWVRSKEGEGTTFSFTLIPYGKLAAEMKSSDNKDIVRVAHGWIKNHSLYRR